MKHIFAVLHWPAIGLRAGVLAAALVAWFWTQSLIARKSAPKEGIGDIVHDLTARWHRYFSRDDRAANAALITSSIFIDLFGFSLIGAAIFGPTFAAFLAMLIVLVLRAHYTLDVVAGALAAFFAAAVAGRLSRALDTWMR